MKTALIEALYCSEGQPLGPGAKILDLSVDLSGAFAQNCPPISYYRVVLREQLWLRRLLVGLGDHRAPGGSVALFSTEPGESIDVTPARAARCMTAGIVYHDRMWSGGVA